MITMLKRTGAIVAFMLTIVATMALSPAATLAASELDASGTVGEGTFEGTIRNPAVHPDQHGHFSRMNGELVGVAEIDGERIEFAFHFEVILYVNTVDCETNVYIFDSFYADDLGGELQLDDIYVPAGNNGLLGGLVGDCGILGGLL